MNQKTLRVAITGSIAVGKSVALNAFASCGWQVVSSDSVVHEQLRPGTDAWRKIKQQFGESILNEDETIHRGRLASCVFKDPSARRQLNRILHPTVLRVVQQRYRAFLEAGQQNIFCVEVPLLVEVAWQGWFDRVIVVCAPLKAQRERLRARGWNPAQIRFALQSQLSSAAKVAFADWVIQANGGIERTETQVQRINMILLQEIGVHS
ncbi:MAG: dephospho-CoA kinase [Fimbriimonadia bacterium]|nr:dephospho-CoA kinase [Fimbriimonadia bacterium]